MKRTQMLACAAFTLLVCSTAFASAQEEEEFVAPAASRNPFGNALASLQARLSNGRRDYRNETADEETCAGIIDAVYCHEDEEGRLSHMAYHNSLTGLQLLGCGRGKDWTRTDATQTLVLAQGEVITEVKTCPGNSRTGISVTLRTDAGQAMTCGSALASARPTDRKQQQPQRDSSQAANSVDEEDREGGQVYEGYAEGSRRSNRRRASRRGAYSNTARQLLAAESDNAAEPAAKRCHTYISEQQPPWTGVPECYESGVEAYCVYKNSRYYKNYNMYLAQLAAYEAAGADRTPYRPRYYYSVVNPLAAFDTECSPKGLVKRVTDVCFNDQYKLEGEPLPVVPIVIIITLDELADGGAAPCPSTPDELRKVQTDLEGIMAGLVALSNGVLGSYSVSINADDCVEGFQNGRTLLQATSNSTFTVTSTLTPGQGYTDRQVNTWLRTNVPTGDACDVNNLCAGTSFSTVILFNVGAPAAARIGTTPAATIEGSRSVEGRQALPARQLLMAPPRKFIQGAAAAGRRAGRKVGGARA